MVPNLFWILVKLPAKKVLSFLNYKQLYTCFFMVLIELSVLSFYTSLNGCFRKSRNHTPVCIKRITLRNEHSCSFAIFIMNDLFRNLVFISYSKNICSKNKQKHLKKRKCLCIVLLFKFSVFVFENFIIFECEFGYKLFIFI